ncbi:MAG: DUF4132 domain-containing protein [Clostridia bacterium]|nr:DUF4132 domain-containing protein [Clostridia bacterium]
MNLHNRNNETDSSVQSEDFSGFGIENIKKAVRTAYEAGVFDSNRVSEEGKNALAFLERAAKEDAESFVSVMKLNERIIETGDECYFFTFFNDFYMMLKENNPEAVEEYDIFPGTDFIELIIERELLNIKEGKKEVRAYLRMLTDISVLESVRDIIIDPDNKIRSDTYHTVCVADVLYRHTSYFERYAAYKAIEHPEPLIREAFVFADIRRRHEYMNELFQILVKENVPVQDRFDIYEEMYDRFGSAPETQRIIQVFVLNLMRENSERFDEAYESVCLARGIFSRQMFVMYLESTNENNKNKDRLLKLCAEDSWKVRDTIKKMLAKHKEYEADIIHLLSAKKQAVREMAVDVLCLWEANNYRDILEKAAETEKNAKFAERIRELLFDAISSSLERAEGDSVLVRQCAEELCKGGRNKKVLWLFETENPVVHFKDGSVADDSYLQAILLCYENMIAAQRNDNALMLAKELNEGELARFSAEIFSKWYHSGADAKKRKAMFFALIHGGAGIVDTALQCITELSENRRGEVAAEAVKGLALNSSNRALIAVDDLARKFKHKQVKNAAIQALDTAAENLGITADELGDRLIPTFGFDDKSERIFDYGSRKFRVYLSPTLEPEIFDESGKKLKTLPSPGKKDDEETAKKSYAEFKAMKKQLKNVISAQKQRLETALLIERRWTRQAWTELFVKNPVMHGFAAGLIWAAYENDEPVQIFRYIEDGSFTTADADEYELPENVTIGLVHPIILDEDTLSAWREQLSDYDVVQPFEQLERKIYRVQEEEKGKTVLERFRGRKVNGMSLIGRTEKLGWSKGIPQDAGCFYVFYREDVRKRRKDPDGKVTLIGNAAELHFEGMYIGGENSEFSIENVRFCNPGEVDRSGYFNNQKAISLDQVSPVYFSEIIRQLETITKTAETIDTSD